MLNKIQVGIAGSGTMGTGIAYLFASKGFDVILYDVENKSIDRSITSLESILSAGMEKGKVSYQEAEIIRKRIYYTTDLLKLKNSYLIIEAIIENLSTKQSLFRSLEEIIPDECILATNTSSLSITAIASACNKPERVIGTHFFNPAYKMSLVEVIPGLVTSGDVTERSIQLLKDINKDVALAKDTPGFIVNRIARPFYGEALRVLEEGIADPATIDWAMKEIGKFKMGPFELMDLIGIDINYSVTQSVFEGFYFDPRYKPSITQKRFVDAKMYGIKSGHGFYNYQANSINPEPNRDLTLAYKIFNRILSMLINEAADAVLFGIASIEDIDLAMMKGVNYPKGLLKWADEIGINKVLNTLNELYHEYKEDRYRPSPLLKRMVKDDKTFYLSKDE